MTRKVSMPFIVILLISFFVASPVMAAISYRAQSSLHIQPNLADTHRDRVSEDGDHPMQRFSPCGPEPWDWRVILSRFH